MENCIIGGIYLDSSHTKFHVIYSDDRNEDPEGMSMISLFEILWSFGGPSLYTDDSDINRVDNFEGESYPDMTDWSEEKVEYFDVVADYIRSEIIHTIHDYLKQSGLMKDSL
jgi:hypothetical protein